MRRQEPGLTAPAYTIHRTRIQVWGHQGEQNGVLPPSEMLTAAGPDSCPVGALGHWSSGACAPPISQVRTNLKDLLRSMWPVAQPSLTARTLAQHHLVLHSSQVSPRSVPHGKHSTSVQGAC